ncbi:MAG: glycosyltransferase family 39 protein [Chloroflexota bacterium]
MESPSSESIAGRQPHSRSSRLIHADVLTLAALMAASAAVRWPNLWLIPAFSDETLEAKLAIAIARGQSLPLTSVDPYIGAGWNYLAAIVMLAFGISAWVPRALAFLFGTFGVVATWLLAREMGGRLAGVVAAVWLAACSTHVLVNSHVGWSHSSTPTLVTAGAYCLVRALTRETAPGAWLSAAALLLGLSVQSHITAVLVLPGCALFVWARRRRLRGWRVPAAALTAFAIGAGTLLVYNILTGGDSFRGGQRVVADYTGEDAGVDPRDYLENLHRLALGTGWVLSGAIEKRRYVGESLLDPLTTGYLTLAITGLAWSARRGGWLPLAIVAPFALAMPLVNPKYEPLLNGRYVMVVLPLVFTAIGVACGDLLMRATTLSRPVRIAGVLLVGLASVYPLVGLVRYERSTERTNHAVLLALEAVHAELRPGETLLVDYGLDSVFYMAAGSAFRSLDLLLTAADTPYTVVDARPASFAEHVGDGPPRLALVAADKLTPLSRAFTLTPVGDSWRGPGFGVYRVSARRG